MFGQIDRGKCLLGGVVTDTYHDDVRIVVAGEIPSHNSIGQLFLGQFGRKPARFLCFASYYYIDLIGCAHDSLQHSQGGVAVGREIHIGEIALPAQYVVDKAWILMAESIVILAPARARKNVVERRYRAAPWHFAGLIQKFGVLVHHTRHDLYEGFVAGEYGMPASHNVALNKPLEIVLAEHFHNPAILAQIAVPWFYRPHPAARSLFEDRIQFVAVRLVRRHEAEIIVVFVEREYFFQV